MSSTTIREGSYRLPQGYGLARVLLRSLRLGTHPVEVISKNMKKFGGTYTLLFPGNRRLIITQDAGFISHILRDKHTNYKKSDMTARRSAQLFGNGLLFSNGDFWLRQRRLIQPGFHSKKLQGLYDIVARTIDESLANFPVGDNIDAYPLIHRLSFGIAVRALFDIELSPSAMLELNSLFTGMQDFLVKDVRHPFSKLWYPFNGKERVNFARSEKLKEIIRDVIRRRQADTGTYNDLLDMLLSARYEDTGEPMSEEQLISEVLILLFAGHETTAATLSWLVSLVSSEKGVLGRLSDIASQIDIDVAVKNEYFQAVINETMRVRPAAWIADRETIADDSYGGYSYPAGTIIMTFFYGLHHSEEHWEQADRFDPMRFIDENGKIRKLPAFFPFGAGPRMCIGNSFAMAEMSLFLRAFFKKFEITPTQQTAELTALITLRPDKVMLNIRRL